MKTSEIDLTYPCSPRIQSTVVPELVPFNKTMLEVKKSLMIKQPRKKKVVENVWDKNVLRRVV